MPRNVDKIRDIVLELWYSHCPENQLPPDSLRSIAFYVKEFETLTRKPGKKSVYDVSQIAARRERMLDDKLCGLHSDTAAELIEYWGSFAE